MSFAGKVVIVTGGGAGIGRAAALRYAARGASVLIADIDEARAGETVREIEVAGGKARAARVDLAGRAAAQAMVQAAVDAFGRLDVLANVAGIYPTKAVEELQEDEWDRVLAVDLRGPFFACQAALKQMKRQGTGGVIVNVASGAAFYGIRGLAAYSAAKGGLVSMSRVVALEGAPYNVRVNVVVPGPTATPGARGLEGGTFRPAGATPLLGRRLEPDEPADVIVWCSSDAARAVNGALLRVDGGSYML